MKGQNMNSITDAANGCQHRHPSQQQSIADAFAIANSIDGRIPADWLRPDGVDLILSNGVTVDAGAVEEQFLSAFYAQPAPARLLDECADSTGCAEAVEWALVARAGLLAVGCADVWPNRNWQPVVFVDAAQMAITSAVAGFGDGVAPVLIMHGTTTGAHAGDQIGEHVDDLAFMCVAPDAIEVAKVELNRHAAMIANGVAYVDGVLCEVQ
jgi:hypothetical protein